MRSEALPVLHQHPVRLLALQAVDPGDGQHHLQQPALAELGDQDRQRPLAAPTAYQRGQGVVVTAPSASRAATTPRT
ncbi:hypothetical protein AB0F45_35315 [Streptomyces achromogenes]|uniref:hypothetical protein n=1 Tax=Streptomyces achromogenes TaxID=67255 RepID=UPI0033E577BA